MIKNFKENANIADAIKKENRLIQNYYLIYNRQKIYKSLMHYSDFSDFILPI